MKKIRKYRKLISAFFLVLLLSEFLTPLRTFALTGGPSQPEVQSFESGNTNQMVDMFSGDFVYNIPLMDVGGYPINISYHSGVTMDQEASWVGLGWNLNPGAITRNMRGLPDDFMGDPVTKELNIRKNWTAGVDLGISVKIDDFPVVPSGNLGIYYNNYRGVGFKSGVGFQYSFSTSSGDDQTADLAGSIGMNISFDSQNGVGVSPNMGLSLESKSEDGNDKASTSLSAGLSFNSRTGINSLTMSASQSASHTAISEGDRSSSTGSSISSTISFAAQSVTPSIDFPMTNFGFTAKLQIGGELPVAPIDINGSITGNYTEQKLLHNTETLGAYGYLYFDKVHQQDQALMDFNREKDQPFRKPRPMLRDEGTPVMAIPNYEYDLFSVSGQGIGGQYRIQRTDVGSVYDHRVDYNSGSGAVSIDVAIGDFAHVGGNIDVSIDNTESGNWKDGNQLYNNLGFSSYNNTDYEPASFVNVGEKTIAEQNLYNEFGGDDPFNVKIDGSVPFDARATKTIQNYHHGVAGSSHYLSDFKRAKRDKRNQPMSYLTAQEAQYAAIDTAILDYPVNSYPIDICNGIPPSINKINRVAQANGQGHHLSELTVSGTDGRRYVYGIPAYNRKNRQATFNVDASWGNIETGLVDYMSGGTNPAANSLNNNIGLDHYFSAENIPDYAHSYLLTSVLSADYVDLTGNGPSDDDYGDYVRMNYSRVYPSSDSNSQGAFYNWRVPYNQANYQEGYKSYTCDDKGNYSYGSKEVWFLNSIESKTMVAIFHLSDREDAVGAKDENGGMGSPKARMKKLDRIDLYSKPDLEKNGPNAVPIKSVFFNYDYSLCPGVDNNTGNSVDSTGMPVAPGPKNVNASAGKLTLKKVYFTYQGNTKGMLNPYIFHYDGNINPRYHIKHYDRWGNYKSNQEYATSQGQTTYVPDAEAPYTIQDTSYTNKAAAAWSLNQIDLPTGGSIKVQLESDQYSSVQNLSAMQMFQVLGMGHDSTSTIDNRFYTGVTRDEQNTFIFVKVDAPVTSTAYNDIRNEISSKYLHDISNLYYRCAIKMYNSHSDAQAEYVPGYCGILNYGMVSGSQNILWLQLNPEPLGKSGQAILNPIVKNAFQFFRINLPSEAYPGGDNLSDCGNAPPSFLGIIKSLIAPIFDIENIFFGFSSGCIVDQRCKYIVPSRSWVRLDNAMGNKLGGGARVKQVTIADNWNQMVAGETAATYGQVYDYTMPDGSSSGVAEYEPMLGGDENPFRQPLVYDIKSLLAPNSQLYMEYPLCESFYPSPNVGYRQVKVTSFGSTQVSADKRTGYSMHKFYTAYDFPVLTDYTPKYCKLDNTSIDIGAIFAILKFPTMHFCTASQGFSIQLNDMHGKPESEEVYDNNNQVVSKTTYNYQTNSSTDVPLKLNNTVTVMNRNGTISQAEIGRNADVNLDCRHQNSATYNIGEDISVDLNQFPFPPIPIPFPAFLPTFGVNDVQFESVTSMKIVHRYGLLQSVTAQQYGSSVTTTNQVYDSETGEVLLTKTQNEFNDPVYAFHYPAHFAYDGMGPSYLNNGAQFTNVTLSNGLITNIPAINQYFTAGDEVLAQTASGFRKLWVIDPNSMNPAAAHQKIFVDQGGNSFTNAVLRMKITRSGHRNMQSVPIGTITSLTDPTLSGSLSPTAATKILNTDATEYKEAWKVNCDQVQAYQLDTCPVISCDCMHNLLYQIMHNHLWGKHLSDSSYLTLCCLDSCHYPDGTSSGPANCKNQYVESGYAPYTGASLVYTANIGNYTLSITKDPNPVFTNGYADTTSLQLLSDHDLVIENDSCISVCDYFAATGSYYMPSLVAGRSPVPYYAHLYYNRQQRQICVNLPPNQTVNPYQYGMLGNWRPFHKWIYRDFRTQDTIWAADTPQIRYNGFFDTYHPFWVTDSVQKKFVVNPSMASQYVDATQIIKYNTKGEELENMDAAGIYSSALYGYLETLATGVAKNSRYKNIGNDNFEDYFFTTDCPDPCRTDHFSFRQSLVSGSDTVAALDTTIAHSGHYSLKVFGSGIGSAVAIRNIIPDNENPGLVFDSIHNCYVMQADACLPKFSPDSGKYYVSVWVREPQICNNLTYANSSLTVSFIGSAQTYTFKPHGNIIEGWQKIDSVFSIPGAATQIMVSLNALNSTDVNFDDIRIEPFNSEMKTYVYDFRTTRLMALLDENNYATFYEYDDRGTPVRLKKETANGIMTIQETRSTLKAK